MSPWAKRPGNLCLQSQVQGRNGGAWKLGDQESLGNPCAGVRPSSASLFSSPPSSGRVSRKKRRLAPRYTHRELVSVADLQGPSSRSPRTPSGVRRGLTPSGSEWLQLCCSLWWEHCSGVGESTSVAFTLPPGGWHFLLPDCKRFEDKDLGFTFLYFHVPNNASSY